MNEDVFALSWKRVQSDPKALRWIYFHYRERHKIGACCDGVIKEYFLAEKKSLKIRSYMKQKSNCRYELKQGAVVYLKSRSIHLTNANLTDELAEELLSNPVYKKYFEKLPNKLAKTIQIPDLSKATIVDPKDSPASFPAKKKPRGKR